MLVMEQYVLNELKIQLKTNNNGKKLKRKKKWSNIMIFFSRHKICLKNEQEIFLCREKKTRMPFNMIGLYVLFD